MMMMTVEHFTIIRFLIKDLDKIIDIFLGYLDFFSYIYIVNKGYEKS